MAYTAFLASNCQNKAVLLLGLLALTAVSLMQTSDATEFKVGGEKGWAPGSINYTHWAETNRFRIGDSLVFDFPVGNDSVLLVKKEDYENCNTDSPIIRYTNCHIVHQFTVSGPKYFISGNKDNCLHKHQKLSLTVMADRSKPPTPAPAPAHPVPTPAPAPAPASPECPASAAPAKLRFYGVIGALTASSLVFVI